MSPFQNDPSYCQSNAQLAQSLYPPIAQPKTVLVVDDDSLFRELEAIVLCQKGYNVLQADCADEALRVAAQAGTLDLLLTDFIMPGTDGVELTKQFRALYPSTPVLMVSGSLPLIPHRATQLDRFAILMAAERRAGSRQVGRVTPCAPFPSSDFNERRRTRSNAPYLALPDRHDSSIHRAFCMVYLSFLPRPDAFSAGSAQEIS